MIKYRILSISIFIHNAKGWALNHIFYTKTLAIALISVVLPDPISP
jgi:hypothetical protein